jgi:hypothetical protein
MTAMFHFRDTAFRDCAISRNSPDSVLPLYVAVVSAPFPCISAFAAMVKRTPQQATKPAEILTIHRHISHQNVM